MRVFILATCRRVDLLPFTLLVFRSIRTGFPKADIYVQGNDLPDFALSDVEKACAQNLCHFGNHRETIDRHWIQQLVESENEPFVLSDTDVIYYESVEGWKFDTALAGCRLPEWQDDFSGAITRARLHPSLMFVDPVKVRAAILEYEKTIPDLFLTPKVNLFEPLVLPFKNRRMFYDTLSFLYHAIGGTAFTDAQLDNYFHMHLGQCSDLVLPRLPNGDKMAEWRKAVLENPELGRGAWRLQAQYLENRQPVYDGKSVVQPINPEYVQEALKWKEEMCMGDREAMSCVDQAFGLFHATDDLVDSMIDGRPLMSRQEIADLMFNQAVFFNCPFFVKHRDILFPILLNINRTWADANEWERSSKVHLRQMADVLRMCSSDLFGAVALIVGGIRHRDYVVRKIKEKDFILQHDDRGRPI